MTGLSRADNLAQIPADNQRWIGAGSMVGRRLRRRPTIETAPNFIISPADKVRSPFYPNATAQIAPFWFPVPVRRPPRNSAAHLDEAGSTRNAKTKCQLYFYF